MFPSGARRFFEILIAPCVLLAFIASLTPARLFAGDWPQILGPNRNGVAVEEHLSASWPAAGPATVWQRAVGSGYAGVAVQAGRLVIFHREARQAIVEGLDAATGKPLWKTPFPTSYSSSIAPDDGPRCVPLLHQGHAYLFGAGGDLHCVRLSDGIAVWSRDLYRDYAAPEGYFGAGSTPIVVGDKLLVNVGGRGAGIVALSLDEGKTLWKATDEAASYSSPTTATIDGARQVIFVTRLNVVSLDPRDGAVRFRFPFGMRGPTVNAATPLVLGDHLFVTASYGVGAAWAKLGKQQPDMVWASDDVMSSQYTTCVEKDGTLYGIDGRQDQGVARLRAIDPRVKQSDGRVKWTQEGFGVANLILADDKLLIVKIDGQLVLAEPSPSRYRELARAEIFNDTVQALPALANGMLYVRDTKTLKCLDLRTAKPAK